MLLRFICLILCATSLLAKPNFNIAIVYDGNSPEKISLEKALHSEIKQLLQRDFNVKFPKYLQFNGDWDYLRITSYIEKAMKDTSSNLVITIGPLSSHIGARKKSYIKPLLAATVIDAHMQKVPLTKKATSGKKNLSYLSGSVSIMDDLENIKEITHCKHVGIVVQSALLRNTPSIGQYLLNKAKKLHMKASLIPLRSDISDFSDAIAEDVDFIYMTPQFHLSSQERKSLYDDLKLKELGSFSATGFNDVKLGALLGDAPQSDLQRLVRQIALQTQLISLGKPASELGVMFKPEKSLTINMHTALEIGFSPSWDLLSKAKLLEQDLSNSHYLSIEDIMNRAASFNLKIKNFKEELHMTEMNVDISESALLPQVSLTLAGKQVDKDRAEASLGSIDERNLLIQTQLKQLIYDQKSWANISVNKAFLKAKMDTFEYLKLDIALVAGSHYIQILKLQTKLDIEKHNVELLTKNISSAKNRLDLGIGSRSDIYRWENKIFMAKKRLLFTHAHIQQERYALNALLNLPQRSRLNFQDINMENSIFLTHKKELKSYFKDPLKFIKFEDFLVRTGLNNAPEIHQYDAISKAKERLLNSHARALYMPTVHLQADMGHQLINSVNSAKASDPFLSAIPDADTNDWSVGLFMSVPLYTGGGQSYEYERAKSAYLSAKTQKAILKNDTERHIRTALYQSKASFLSIKLAHESFVSAEKNFRLVQDTYSHGNTNILHLLDAQNTSLRAALQENDNKYDFLLELLILQRSIGQVNFNVDKATWALWLNDLKNFTEDD